MEDFELFTEPNNYTSSFFDSIASGSYASAREIIPIVVELVNPTSVIDIGCGTGEWLRAFADFGITDYLGVDGAWIDIDQLKIMPAQFLKSNLTEPVVINREFDLVVSLEVGEHIPKRKAGTFVESLTKLGAVVLFSAAVPKQGGNGHVNEQWPEYWVSLFEKRGYVVFDCIRKRVWKNPKVSWWYAQNTFLFVSESHLSEFPGLQQESCATNKSQLTVIHPYLFIKKASGHEKYKATLKHRLIVRLIRIINSFPPHLQKVLRPVTVVLMQQKDFKLHDISWP